MLIDHLVKEPETSKIHVYSVTKKQEQEAFKKNLVNALNPQMILDFGDKKVINEARTRNDAHFIIYSAT